MLIVAVGKETARIYKVKDVNAAIKLVAAS
jgi:hypothetical protein